MRLTPPRAVSAFPGKPENREKLPPDKAEELDSKRGGACRVVFDLDG